MPNLRQIISDVRKARYHGTDKASAFVSGDVAAGKVRDVTVRNKPGDKPKTEPVRDGGNDET